MGAAHQSVPGSRHTESMMVTGKIPIPPRRCGGSGRQVVTAETTSTRRPETLDRVVIRFAGDSGDAMQRAGDRFTDVSAACGTAPAPPPTSPAEIRAPAGTIAGVSSFQVHISDHDILTPGDSPNVLVAMNPAALKANIKDMPPGATLLLNEDAFEQRNLDKAGYQANPIEDGSLSAYRIVQVPMTSITLESTKDLGVKPRDAERSKNFFALGLLSWMYTRPIDPIVEWINERFGSKPTVRDANLAAFKAGYHFGETAELFDHPWEVLPADLPPGRYRNITGNVALAYGLIAASQSSKLPIAYASYPITPASDILHELSRHKNFGVRTLQAEDEIGAAGVAVGAAFPGHLVVTATSGPGMDLKADRMGLAVSLGLPDIGVPFAESPNHDGDFWPYLRDPETLARPWAIPGTPGLMHRIGGLEKEDGTGNVNYDPENHEHMVRIRAEKVARIAGDIPPVEVDDPDDADLLVLGWGSTWGSIQAAVRRVRAGGKQVAHAHLVHMNPFPANLGEVLSGYPKILVPEMNLGQLSRLVRAEYLVDAQTLSKVQGVPFSATEIEARILEMLDA